MVLAKFKWKNLPSKSYPIPILFLIYFSIVFDKIYISAFAGNTQLVISRLSLFSNQTDFFIFLSLFKFEFGTVFVRCNDANILLLIIHFNK